MNQKEPLEDLKTNIKAKNTHVKYVISRIFPTLHYIHIKEINIILFQLQENKKYLDNLLLINLTMLLSMKILIYQVFVASL